MNQGVKTHFRMAHRTCSAILRETESIYTDIECETSFRLVLIPYLCRYIVKKREIYYYSIPPKTYVVIIVYSQVYYTVTME